MGPRVQVKQFISTLLFHVCGSIVDDKSWHHELEDWDSLTEAYRKPVHRTMCARSAWCADLDSDDLYDFYFPRPEPNRRSKAKQEL
mmetsp:Transcript_4874/g.9423  ORF Transcript_4874/g.9423 Transcript_4874/m.9423 type:complete len:86 (+) Transcript_4874:46-303(+)